jgi:succinate dehydrogenase/fumarate reductase flavoprotein subunit
MMMLSQKTIETDVLVIGGGMAGTFAAVKAKEQGLDVTLVDKGYVGKAGGTHFAEGDIVYFRPERGHKLEDWVNLISERCEYINSREWDEVCLREAKDRYDDLVSWGVRFYQEDSKPYVYNYYGAAIRTKYEDITMVNREYAPTLRKKAVESGVRVLDKITVCELLKQDGKIVGALGFHAISGNLYVFHAKATVIATGGSSLKAGTYPVHFWTGDGEAMAYGVGAEITGKEFMYGTPPLRSDINRQRQMGKETGISGEVIDVLARFPFAIGGGFTGWFIPNLNAEGDPVVNVSWEAHCGRAPLYFDLAGWPLERIQWLRTFFKRIGTCQPDKIDLDVLRGGKVQWPAARVMTNTIFAGSGIWSINTSCATAVPGLYAAGNSCATMTSGATYAGMGVALNHAMVTGARAGLGAAEHALKSKKIILDEAEITRLKKTVYAPMERKGGFSPRWVTQVLQNIMLPYYICLVKHGERMQAALTLVEFLENHLVPKLMAKDAHELRLAQETRNMALNAEMMLRASLFRTESRGSHFREDYPRRDDPNWLAWVKLKEENGKMKVLKVPIPEKWWPDLSKPYEERYPRMLPMECPLPPLVIL